MKAKSEQKAQPQASNTSKSNATPSNALSEEDLIKIFSSGEKAQKTPRGAKPPSQTPAPQVTAPVQKEASSSKKKKGKK